MNTIGIDLGGTNIKGVLADESGNILGFIEVPTPQTASQIAEAISIIAGDLLENGSAPRDCISAMGIGSAGTIDRAGGTVIMSANIPCLSGYPLAEKIHGDTGMHVYLENDATAAVTGARWRIGPRFSNWILITLGTGIGGGMVFGNTIYRGKGGNSMEPGHMTVEMDGRKCRCGNRGCLELYASATALVRRTRALIQEGSPTSLNARMEAGPLTAKMIHEEAVRGDPVSLKAFHELGRYLGAGVANLVNIFAPDAVLFAGGLSQAHGIFLPLVEKEVQERALPGFREGVVLMPLADQSAIPALGAARIAMNNL